MTKTLTSTKGMTHEDWLEARKKGIGGSDAGAVAGLNRWKSPVEVWLDKTEQIPPKEQTEKMYWGTVLEDVIAEEFSKRTGKAIRRRNAILQHPDHPFMLANIDREIVGEKTGLECKNTSRYMSTQWTETEFPQEYLLQCMHYMAVTGYTKWYLAVLVNGSEFRIYEIDRDEELINDLIKIESDFWKLVEDHIPPEPDGTQASTITISRAYPEADEEADEIDLPDTAEELIQQYFNASTTIKEYEIMKAEAENKLKNLLKESPKGRTETHRVIWRNITSNRLDSKALKNAHPDIYSEFTKESTSRRFEIKEVKE